MKIEAAARLRSSIGTISFGVFIVLVGIFFIVFPVMDEAHRFFDDIKFRPVIDGIRLPLPLSEHSAFYHIISNFAAVWGVWLIAVVILRIVARDEQRKIVHTLTDCVFWIGLAFLLSRIEMGSLQFRDIFAGIIILIGIGIVARATARILRKT